MHATRIGRPLAGAALLIGAVTLPVVVEETRVLYLVVACLLLPGAGWAQRFGTGDLGDRTALAVGISLSTTILVATAMVATDTWSLPVGFAALAVVSALGFVPFPEADRPRTTRSGDWDGRHTRPES